MANGLRALMLLTDGFGGRGGIAKFNHDFLRALDGCSLIQRVYALPRILPEPIHEPMPESVVYDRAAARGRLAFLLRLAAHAWRGGKMDLVICGHLHLLPAAWLVARLRGGRLVLIIHGIEAWAPSRRHLSNWLARRVDELIAVSQYSAERFTRWSKLSMDRVFILPNCVDLDQFRPQHRDANLVERYGLLSSKVILTVGRLASAERYKGFDQVIELMPQIIKRFPTLKYLIVGDGDDRRRLEEKVKALGLSGHVIFAGYVPELEKVAHYNLADVYVMPSKGEGFGIVLLEAVACGVPVVGSRVDGSREALLDGVLGHLVDPGNPVALLGVITSVLEGTKPPERIDMIKTFGVQTFRAHVEAWCRAQVTGMNQQGHNEIRFGRP
jgi:glycosyltransferase involved in cell wall biosynthesis